jgi:hypothetical protein
MDQPQAHGPGPDHVTAALEAGCGALLALEVARQEMADSDSALDPATREVERAMASLRRAIDLLHAFSADGAPAEDIEMLARGFVLDER